MPHRRSSTWFIIVLVIVFAGVFTLEAFGFSTPLRHTIVLISVPLQIVSEKTVSFVEQTTKTIFGLKDLQKENRVMSRQLNKLETENASLNDIKKENEALRQQLELSLKTDHQLTTAVVLGRDPLPIAKFLTINRGSNHGIQPGLAALSEGGALVGIVHQVGTHTASVLLLTDTNSAINALIEASDAQGIVKGEIGLGLRMELIPQEKVINVGDRVISSGLGGQFPRGLLIGSVESVQTSDNALYQKATIVPEASIDNIRVVSIVTKSSP